MAECEPIREVRFGVVLYGGVSLAVYINGVVQELFSLVRATAPQIDPSSEEPLSDLLHRDGELTGAEPVYRDLGRIYDDPSATVAAGGMVRTRFVVDIISGSSAGGINGVYLAKALANQQSFARLRELWVTKAGVGDLLNDRKSKRSRAKRLSRSEPAEALFSGDIMYLELLDALDDMDRPTPGAGPDDAPPSPYVRDLDLWITATDLAGSPLPLRLADSTILEKSHRHTFHFVFGEAQADKRRRNDFAAPMNPILAFAARATSAFPFAFVPARLADIMRVQRVRDGVAERADPHDQQWRPWFRNQRLTGTVDYENVCFGDGGDMDNKPFGWVIDTLPSRTSSAPVDRRLLYVEPDPGDPMSSAEAATRPDFIDSSIAAVSLGRVENIRDDIDRLARVSEVRERIGAVAATVDARFATGSRSASMPTDEWLRETPDEMRARGLAYAAYLCLRVETLITEYARSLVGLPWHAAETPASAAMRALVAHWVSVTYADPFTAPPEAQTTKHFLRDFDIAFRIRRLAFVAGQADRLHRTATDHITESGMEDSGTPGETYADTFRGEARRMKQVLSTAERQLRLWVPSIRSNRDLPPDDFVLPPAAIAGFSKSPTGWAAATWEDRHDAFVAVANEIRGFLDALFLKAKQPVREALDDRSGPSAALEARRRIGTYFDRFGDFDEVIFPLHAASGIGGEIDPVQVHRISPRDATALVDPAQRPKVAGARLGHFGGFLDARWRANDIMWGRLDTAERLVRCLVPEAADADEMLRRAHDAILREEWYSRNGGGAHHLADARATGTDTASRDWRITTFTDEYVPPPWPPTADLMGVASRATQVTSQMLEGVAGRPGIKIVHRLVAGVAWMLAAVTAVVFPGGIRRTPIRWISAFVLAVGILLATAGTVVNWDAASSTGRVLIIGGVAALLVVLLVRLARRSFRRAVLWLLVACVLASAVYGGWRFVDDHPLHVRTVVKTSLRR